VTQRELRTWNKLDSRGRIRIGQRLRVLSPDAPTPSAPPAAAPEGGSRTHVVQRGETLEGLARRYRVPVQALRKANGMSERTTLRAGVSLKIPG